MQMDIRWEQRFSNYRKALSQLRKFFDKDKLSDLEEQGLIKAFEYTYELAWNTMKDFLEYQGSANNITGSRDTFREAFKAGLIFDGHSWMEMVESRNRTSHSYNEEVANEIVKNISSNYYYLFLDFEQKMERLRSGSNQKLF
jgi:nucleotidyltransferase substrate binding protein (TIGR01987 family)